MRAAVVDPQVAGAATAPAQPAPDPKPTPPPAPPPPRCGDGNVDAGEICDDGNEAHGDGCSARCRPEMVTHVSPKGTDERCQLLVPFPFTPDGVELDEDGYGRGTSFYREEDAEDVAELCAMDLYAEPTDGTPPVGVCPKIHGTQPAIEIYDLADTKLTKERFEKKRCPLYRQKRKATKLAKFKTAVFEREGESAIMYFHFSRLLGNQIVLYPATYREIALAELVRWANQAIKWLEGKDEILPQSPRTSWGRLRLNARIPTARSNEARKLGHARLMVEGSDTTAFGSLAKNPRGERGHEAFSFYKDMRIGRAPGFRLTSYYKLINSRKPVAANLKLDPKSRRYKQELQLLAHARDFTYLVILDAIFNQRDRLGNMHERTYHHSIGDDGKLHTRKKATEGDGSIPLVRLVLKDNDEGLVWWMRPRMELGILIPDLRHVDPTVYARIQWLAGLMRDEATAPLVKRYFVEAVHVRPATYDEVRDRFLAIADRFKRLSESGKLMLDLDLEAALRGDLR
jgi:cysteine-rich repeat protein